jgi:probable rRNA maturation factor
MESREIEKHQVEKGARVPQFSLSWKSKKSTSEKLKQSSTEPSRGRIFARARSVAKAPDCTHSSPIIEVQELAQIRLKKLLEVAQSLPGLARLSRRKPWVVHLKVVGRARIQKLNQMYRNRAYPTDVLSFSAPEPFRALGILGELVIGLPVLKAQARRLGHSPSAELDVLLVHGLLHLLGLDHEEGPKEAQVMAQWEVQLLSRWGRPESRDLGLIDRSHSGSKKG